MKLNPTAAADSLPGVDHIDDVKLAASKMSRMERRAFQAEMALKYCAGNARRAEDIFGWSRDPVTSSGRRSTRRWPMPGGRWRSRIRNKTRAFAVRCRTHA